MRKTSLVAILVLMGALFVGGVPTASSEDPVDDPYHRAFFGAFKDVVVHDPDWTECGKSRGAVQFSGVRWPSWAHLYRIELSVQPGQDVLGNPLDRCKAFVPFADTCIVEGAPDGGLDGVCDSGGVISMKIWPRDDADFMYQNVLGGRYTADMWTSFIVCANTNFQPFLTVGYCGENVNDGSDAISNRP